MVFLVLALLAPCDAEAERLIKIAIQTPLSGEESISGIDIKRGAELALEQLKKPIEDMGFTVVMEPFDDQANPAIGVENAKRIAQDPEILAVIGHYNSGVQIPASEIYHAAGLANLSPANTSPAVTDRSYPEISRIVGRDDVQGLVGAEFAALHGITRAFAIHDQSAYGRGIAAIFREHALKKGVAVLGFASLRDQSDTETILSEVDDKQPELLYFGGTSYQAASFLKAARQRGFSGIFLSDDGFDSSNTAEIAGPALLAGQGVYYSTVSGPATLYPDATRFIHDFREKYPGDPQPFAAQAYDCMAMCLKALENAARDTAKKDAQPSRAAVAKAIRALNGFKGITGSFSFNDKGDPTSAKYFIIQVKSDDPKRWNENIPARALDVEPPR
jgi:branched-chain amino acid transport system substrate-binding protein